MKKVMLIGLLFAAQFANAACIGGTALCFDDTGVTVNGQVTSGNGNDLPSASSTTISTLKAVVGREIVCNTCVNAGLTGYGLCIATSTTNGAYVMVSSTSLTCK